MICPYMKKILEHEQYESEFLVLAPDFKVQTVSKFLEMVYTGKTVVKSSDDLLALKEFGPKQLGFTMLVNWNIEIEEQPLQEEIMGHSSNDSSSTLTSAFEAILPTISIVESPIASVNGQLFKAPFNINRSRDNLTSPQKTISQDSSSKLTSNKHNGILQKSKSTLTISMLTNPNTKETDIHLKKPFQSVLNTYDPGSNVEKDHIISESRQNSKNMTKQTLVESPPDLDQHSVTFNAHQKFSKKSQLPKIGKLKSRNVNSNTNLENSNFLKHSIQREIVASTSLLSNESIISKQELKANQSKSVGSNLKTNTRQMQQLRSPKLIHTGLSNITCLEQLDHIPEVSRNERPSSEDQKQGRKRSLNNKTSEPLKKKTNLSGNDMKTKQFFPEKEDLDCSNDSTNTNFDTTEHFSIQSLVDKHESMLNHSQLREQSHLKGETKLRNASIKKSSASLKNSSIRIKNSSTSTLSSMQKASTSTLSSLQKNENSKQINACTITSNDSILSIFSPLRESICTKSDLNKTDSSSNESFVVKQPIHENPCLIFNQHHAQEAVKPTLDDFLVSKNSSFEMNNTMEITKSPPKKKITTLTNAVSEEDSNSKVRKTEVGLDIEHKSKTSKLEMSETINSINTSSVIKVENIIQKSNNKKGKINVKKETGNKPDNGDHAKSLKKLRPKNFTCPKCNKKFETNYKLKLHDDVNHLKLKLHECQICGKQFGLVYNLRAHMLQIHNGVKPVQTTKRVFEKKFDCNECTERFISTKRLNAHIQTVHLKLKPHKCPQCSAAFGFIHNLKSHFNSVHQREKTHQCKLCPIKFSHGGHLNRHVQAVHEQQKTYRCKLCPIKFSLERNLNKHMDTTHPKDWTEKVPQTFDCSMCNLKYHQKVNLEKHIKMIHFQQKNTFATPNPKAVKKPSTFVTSTPMSSYAAKNLDNAFDLTFESL